ncbi:MAG: HEAT repeat domain-containing protein [Pirellulaceae bacterium]|nr:HEAT repeat domain-containing protein [Pirellulaceae bacterium]
MGRLADRAAVPGLVAALDDPEASVRREAAKSLGNLKDARSVPGLSKSLADRDANVRFYAAYALGEIKDPQAGEALVRALSDPQWTVRDQAAWALRELHQPEIAPRLVAALKSPQADFPAVMWLLRQLGPEYALDAAAGLLTAPDVQTRLRALQTLAAIEDPGRIPPLLTALHDREAAVRLVAVRALAEAGDERARQGLERQATAEQDAVVQAALQEAITQLSPRKHLVAWWSFDDGNTRVAKDVTGNGNDGEIRGCTPVAGRVGTALQFADGRFIELGQPKNLPIADQPFTVMAWAKTEAARGVVVARGGAFCGFSLYVKDGIAKFGIHRLQDGPTYIAAGTERVVGDWVHLAGVVHADRIEVYVNARLAGTAKTDGLFPGNCGQGMEIGFDVANSPAEITDAFDGVIDEVKFFHAALSEQDIAAVLEQR